MQGHWVQSAEPQARMRTLTQQATYHNKPVSRNLRLSNGSFDRTGKVQTARVNLRQDADANMKDSLQKVSEPATQRLSLCPERITTVVTEKQKTNNQMKPQARNRSTYSEKVQKAKKHTEMFTITGH